MSPRRLIIVALLGINGCFAGSRAYATRNIGSELVVAIDTFYARSGAYPDSMVQLCNNRRADCRDVAGLELRDGWGKPFRYTRKNSGYLLQSSGADRRWGTSDDIDYSHPQRDSIAALHAGCWRILTAVPGRQDLGLLQLTERKLETGEWVATNYAGAPIGQWTPWHADSVLASLYGRPIVELSALNKGDSLSGTAEAFADHGRQRSRREFRAVKCR